MANGWIIWMVVTFVPFCTHADERPDPGIGINHTIIGNADGEPCTGNPVERQCISPDAICQDGTCVCKGNNTVGNGQLECAVNGGSTRNHTDECRLVRVFVSNETDVDEGPLNVTERFNGSNPLFNTTTTFIWREDCPCPLVQVPGEFSGNRLFRVARVQVDTEEDCLQLCDLDPWCTAADYNGGDFCSLYDSYQDPVPNDGSTLWRRDCSSSGFDCEMTNTTMDVSGNPEDAAGAIDTPDWKECLVYCMTDVQCVAVDFNPDNTECRYYYVYTPIRYQNGSKFARKQCKPCDVVYCETGADPHVTTFGGSRAKVNYPCLARLTRYVTDNGEEADPHLTCDVDVRVWTEAVADKGRFFAAGVDIYLNLTLDNGDSELINVWLEGEASNNINDVPVYRLYAKGTNINVTSFGEALYRHWNGVMVYVYVDKTNKFIVFYVPDCCTRIKFRPFNRDLANTSQLLVPGVTILAPTNASWDTPDSVFPFSLCGRPYDEDLDLHNRDIIKAAMIQNIQPQDLNANGYFDACNYTGEEYETCPLADRQEALSTCSDVLLKNNLVQCQLEQGQNVMENFAKCHFAICGIVYPQESDYCQDFVNNTQACPQFLTNELANFNCP